MKTTTSTTGTTPWRLGNTLAAAFALCIFLYLGWMFKAHSGWGGSSPGETSAGSVSFIQQRAMEQYCTGVVETPQATWLVGRMDDSDAATYTGQLPRQPFAIETLLGHAPGSGGTYATFLSRRNAEGRFELLATVSEAACLVASPDGTTLFLLTGLDRPRDTTGTATEIWQRAVFRSDDQGQTWQWLREGLFPQAESVAWAMHPSFYGQQGMWVFGGSDFNAVAEGTDPVVGTIYHSPDLGRTVEEVVAPAALRAPESAFVPHLPPGTRTSSAFDDDLKRFVLQVADDRAFAWTGQSVLYIRPGARLTEGRICTHAVAELRLREGVWQGGPVHREFGACLDKLQQSADGRILAVLRTDKGRKNTLVEFDTTRQRWTTAATLPDPFWPLPSRYSVGDMRVGKQAIVVQVHSEHVIPGWMTPFSREPAEVSATATYYSTDRGNSWSRIALPGYLGIMGMGVANDRLFGNTGAWFESSDLTVRSFDLSR